MRRALNDRPRIGGTSRSGIVFAVVHAAVMRAGSASAAGSVTFPEPVWYNPIPSMVWANRLKVRYKPAVCCASTRSAPCRSRHPPGDRRVAYGRGRISTADISDTAVSLADAGGFSTLCLIRAAAERSAILLAYPLDAQAGSRRCGPPHRVQLRIRRPFPAGRNGAHAPFLAGCAGLEHQPRFSRLHRTPRTVCHAQSIYIFDDPWRSTLPFGRTYVPRGPLIPVGVVKCSESHAHARCVGGSDEYRQLRSTSTGGAVRPSSR
jgi:hypothetical protein